jgi:hypothetical protein
VRLDEFQPPALRFQGVVRACRNPLPVVREVVRPVVLLFVAGHDDRVLDLAVGVECGALVAPARLQLDPLVYREICQEALSSETEI